MRLIGNQSRDIKKIVNPFIKTGSWVAHSEAILQTMLCSEKVEERSQAVEKILNIRGEGDEDTQTGNSYVRPRKTPDINPDASSLTDLIDWTSVSEPPLTCNLTTAAVRAFVDCPMEVPNWPSHTQSVERCIKMVTEAAAHVYSQERREGYIRSKVVSRELMSMNKSKKDLANLVKFKRPIQKK